MEKKTIAVTGAGGNMGRVIVKGLREAGYKVISCVHHARGDEGERILELSDMASCLACFEGADAIIHMGFFKKPQREFFIPGGVDSNIIGMYNLYEAARTLHIKRVIFGSSNHVYGFYPVDAEVGDYAPYRPDSIYGLCKCWGELMGRYYSDRFGISCFNIRIGHSLGDREKDNSGTREFRQWISNRDLVQLMIRCIEADPSMLYRCYPGISDNEDMWSLENARAELGYEPEDDGRDLITPETRVNDTELKGGNFPLY